MNQRTCQVRRLRVSKRRNGVKGFVYLLQSWNSYPPPAFLVLCVALWPLFDLFFGFEGLYFLQARNSSHTLHRECRVGSGTQSPVRISIRKEPRVCKIAMRDEYEVYCGCVAVCSTLLNTGSELARKLRLHSRLEQVNVGFTLVCSTSSR